MNSTQHGFRKGLSSFADDTAVQISKNTDCDNLQKDLNVIYEWATENNMKFNIDKISIRLLQHKTFS